MNTDTVDWSLAAAISIGVMLVLVTTALADATGLTGVPAFAAPLLVGVTVAGGIRLGYG